MFASGTGEKYDGTTTIVNLSDTTARNSTALAVGKYKIMADVACYIKQGDSTVEAATTDRKIAGGQEIPVGNEYIVVDSSDVNYIAGITDAATGKLFITKVKELVD